MVNGVSDLAGDRRVSVQGRYDPNGSPEWIARLVRRPGWFLTVIFTGIPLWWVLGVTEIVFFLMSVPMLIFLLRRRSVKCPKGTGVWLLFLVWLLSGLFVMQVDAPGAEPGSSMGRYLVFAYRFGWYTVATIALLYVTNTRRSLSTQRISFAVSWLFVSLIAGGVLGLLLPRLEFPSALEMVLPQSIAQQDFIHSLIHPRVAQLQDFLGYVQPRPTAPFFFANQWGINVAMTLPHFLVSWWQRGGRWRIAMMIILIIAAYPIVASLNRTMWGALGVMAVYVVAQLALRGHVRAVVIFGTTMAVAVAALLVSPLGDLVIERFNTPHSDEGRSNLVGLTVQSTLEGSPIIGYGTTRDVAGNFSSISGGPTAECPSCAPPPLGTHGQIWLLLFGSGIGGALLFVGFYTGQMLRRFRDPSPYTLAAQATLVALFVMMPFYPGVQSAIVIVMISVGILHREAPSAQQQLVRDLTLPVSRHWRAVLGCALAGAAVGLAIPAVAGVPVTATQSVHVGQGLRVGSEDTRVMSMDSEALIATAGPVVDAVSTATGISDREEIKAALELSAPPNSRILDISYTSRSVETSVAASEAAASTFSDLRQLVGSDQASANLSTDVIRQTVSRSTDMWFVSVGTGVGVATVLGMLLAYILDGRIARLGHNPGARLGLDLPVLLHISARDTPGSGDFDRAVQVAQTYAPLGGVFGVSTRPEAIVLANYVDRELARDWSNVGDRALLVACTTTRLYELRRLHAWCSDIGLQPVGLILIDPPELPDSPPAPISAATRRSTI